jgi:hypothetical protein
MKYDLSLMKYICPYTYADLRSIPLSTDHNSRLIICDAICLHTEILSKLPTKEKDKQVPVSLHDQRNLNMNIYHGVSHTVFCVYSYSSWQIASTAKLNVMCLTLYRPC